MALTGRIALGTVAALFLLPLASAVQAQKSQSEIDELSRQCEAQREEKLAPIRAERIKDCKEQGLKAPDHCERYYQTYGNVGRVGGIGAPRSGMFYDLPVCQEWVREREISRASRSRIPS